MIFFTISVGGLPLVKVHDTDCPAVRVALTFRLARLAVPPAEHATAVRVQPVGFADSVTTFASPSWLPVNVKTFVFDNPGSASSSSEKPLTPAPVPVNAKFCSSFGTASFTIVSVASFAFVKVHDTESPAPNVAVTFRFARLAVPPAEHRTTVGEQPVVFADSVTTFASQSWLPSNENTFVFDNPGSASSSSEKTLTPEPVPVNAKSCSSFGTASFTIVSVAPFVFVKVHVTASPAASVAVTLRFAKLAVPPAEHATPVSVHPVGFADSVTTFASPSWSPLNVKTFVFDNPGSASSSSEKPLTPEPVPVNAKSCPSFGTASRSEERRVGKEFETVHDAASQTAN